MTTFNASGSAEQRGCVPAHPFTTGERYVPPLEHGCGSWIVVRRATGQAVLETFNHATAEAVNHDAYEVLTAHQWLVRLNADIRGGTP